MFTLNDLQKIKEAEDNRDMAAVRDRNWYQRGKEGYPTASPESLPQSVTEAQRGCYAMGYNTAQWEDGYELPQKGAQPQA